MSIQSIQRPFRFDGALIVFLVFSIVGISGAWILWQWDTKLSQHKIGHAPTANTGIICLSPAVTEMLYALELQDQLLAVGDHCQYPPAAQNHPRAGSYLNPNLEKILFIKPHWLIIQGKNPELERVCQSAGIELLAFDLTDITSIFSAMTRLGTLFDCPVKAEALTRQIQSELAAIKTQYRTHSRPRTLLCLSRSAFEIADLITANHMTFAGELLELAGGDNLMGDQPQPYPTPALSAIIQQAPEVILDVWGDKLQAQSSAQRLADWCSLPMLPAVASHRVYLVDRDYFLIPGPRVAQAARDLAELLHGKSSDPIP